MKTYNIGELWRCPACESAVSVTLLGVTCRGAGHAIYHSLESLSGYVLEGAPSVESTSVRGTDTITVPEEGSQSKLF